MVSNHDEERSEPIRQVSRVFGFPTAFECLSFVFSSCFASAFLDVGPRSLIKMALGQELKNLARSVSALQASVGQVQELQVAREAPREPQGDPVESEAARQWPRGMHSESVLGRPCNGPMR